jgi:hypothetical protein
MFEQCHVCCHGVVGKAISVQGGDEWLRAKSGRPSVTALEPSYELVVSEKGQQRPHGGACGEKCK